MTQYRTNNPLGSMAPRDLFDNAQNVDNWANGEEPFYEDRFGVMRRSFSGMNFEFEAAQEGRDVAFDTSLTDKESRFQAFLVSSGYVNKGDYAADVVLEERNEYVAVSAATTGTTAGLYRPGPGATLPLTLTGTWETDSANLVLLGDDVLRQELAGSDGANLIGFDRQSAAAEATVSGALVHILDSTVDVTDRRFGAKLDGVTNDSAAIQAAITQAKSMSSPHLVIPQGTAYTGTDGLVFDLPDGSTMEFFSKIVSNRSGGAAVVIGSNERNCFGYRVTGLDVRRQTDDLASSSQGVILLNTVWSHIDARWIQGFTEGLRVQATQGNGGVSHCQVKLGQMANNKTGIRLTASGDGYGNENTFYGGSFANFSDIGTPTGLVGIQIEHNAAHAHNNNRFFGPSLENGTTDAVAAFIEGYNNVIYQPRLENPAALFTYPIIFGANSHQCAVVGSSYGLWRSNIQDNGTDNIYECIDGGRVTRFVQSGEPLQEFKSSVSSGAKLISGLRTDNVESFFLTGLGVGYLADTMYAENGIRFRTSDGTRQDRGIFLGSGSPEGLVAANPGSLYLNQAGGAGATLWVKETGGGNTGWIAK